VAKAAEKDLTSVGLRSRKRFINRELSWLAFNERVLEEAMNERHPLLERLRFLSISGTNLDEFFIVRVAGLRAQVRAGVRSLSQDGRTPMRQFGQVNSRAITLMVRQQETWRVLKQELADQGISVLHPADLDEKAQSWLDDHFTHEIFPVLTPLAADPAHPFPFIPNGGMSLALSLRRAEDGASMSALLPLPSQMPRFIRLPGRAKKADFVKVEDVICRHLDALFPGFAVEEVEHFRILRDSDVEIEDKAEDLFLQFESLVKRRRRGSVISLRVSSFMSKEMKDSIIQELDVQEENVFQASSLLGIGDLRQLIISERPDLLFDPFVPRLPERIRDFNGDHFAAIRAKDLLVHHPYESFDVVVNFVRQAARDPDVVAIKQTLYRTSDGSPIVRDLIEAAESGKNVTALVELKARFDEEANIRLARKMETAGLHGPFILHVRREVVSRRGPGFQFHHGVRPPPRSGQVGRCTLPSPGYADPPHRRGNRARRGRPAGDHLGQAQRPRGQPGDRRAVPRLRGGRSDPSGRERNLLPATGHSGAFGEHHGTEPDRTLPGA
jgi:polyphosphate kinase